MDHFDVTTGVLDSWDLLNCPVLDTCKNRFKEKLQDDNSNGVTSSSSILLKTTPYPPVLNSISSGYYPLCVGTYKICPAANDRPLIQVTVIPKPSQIVSNSSKRRKTRTKKPALPALGHSTSSTKNIYILLPGRKKDKVYAIDKTNAKIFKEINNNSLLSECIIKSYFREMNKAKKKGNEKTKEKREQLKSVPECSPECGYLNIMNRTKTVSPDRSGLASPRSPVRSNYKVLTKIASNKSISSENRQTDARQIRSPDRVSVKDATKTKSPVRTSRQKTQINIYQKGKSNGKETIKSPDRCSYISDKRSVESVIAETKRRSPEIFDERGLNASRPGRIRITGRLGLTEDDKCILKCNATLDDEPIETQFQDADCAMLPTCFQAYKEDSGDVDLSSHSFTRIQYSRYDRKQRDAKVQAKEGPTGVRFYSRSTIGKESQATQVDFQLLNFSAKDRREECSRGKIIQKCACVNTINNVPDDEQDKGIALKKHHSPIIVISVYSKNGVAGDKYDDVKQNDIKVGQKRDNKKLGRSRSPSPAKNNKKISGKHSESRVNASSSKKTIRVTTKKETRSKVNESQSKNFIRSNTATKTRIENKTNKNKTQRSQKTPPQSRRSKSPEMPSGEGNVTEQMIKKALIDDFTKNYADQMIQRKTLEMPLQTKHNVSNITIDIEGDSDYYNVKLEQDVGKINTELTVRKPDRGKRAGELATGETDTTSLENFLYIQQDDAPRKRSFSQTLMYDGTDVAINSVTESRNELNVKDSIEISHRREHKASVEGNSGRNSLPKVDTEYSYLAPNKHFQGDSCSVSDPNARDKEIRRLLGIDKGIKQPQCKLRRSKTTSLLGKIGQVPLHSICDSFSSTTQIKNSKIVLKDLHNQERIDSLHLYDTIRTVKLNQPLYQLMWNQNVQLLYQLNFRKQKPIVLTRHQYAKVKKTIYNTLIQKHNSLLHAKWYNQNRRIYECMKGRAETKDIMLHYDKECQTKAQIHESSTPSTGQLFTMVSDIDTYSINQITNCGDGSSKLSTEKGKINVDSSHETFERSSNANWTQHAIKFDKYVHNVQRTVLIARDLNRPNSELFKKEYRRKSTSVREIQYKRVAVTKQKVKFSSSDTIHYRVESQNIEKNDSCSIHTIFKSHQKSVTPNLGTSANSLCDDSERFTSRLKIFDDSVNQNQKPKKPFLRRLISCLVFRISPVSQPSQQKISRTKLQHLSPNSSFDSYHISTSLAAIDMSSSLYDTTASFYSDHTIQPVARMKRGFFSSVRGFLGRKI